MTGFSEQNHLSKVLQRLQETDDPRLKEVMEAFTRHMFAFINEVKPTGEEWMQGIQFLTETGQMCSDTRQEWILFSDVTGVSMLVDHHNHLKEPGATESSVLGPFYREEAPEYQNGQSISQDNKGDLAIFSGKVTDKNGDPVVGAKLDVWQTAPNGMYEVQDPAQPEFNLRGVFTTDDDGSYEIHTVKPVSYPVPTDGPVGRLLEVFKRHPYRPAHVHFVVSAAGHDPVVTQLFTEGDEFLESDAVFGVKDSLVVPYQAAGNAFSVTYNFVLEKSD